jgi:hypothetical protein
MGGQSSSNDSLSQNLSNLLSNYQNNSNFGQSVFNQDALKQMYGRAGDMYGQQQGEFAKMQPWATDFTKGAAADTQKAWQDQLLGGAYQGVNAGDIQSQLQQSMQDPSKTSQIYAQMMGGEGNNYADAMKGQYMKDAQRAQEQMLSNLDARAAGAGQSGSSRHGIAQGLGMRGINDALQGQLAKTGYETFDKDLQNKLGIAGQADQNTLARQQLMQNMLSGKQSAMQGGIQNASGVQNLGMGAFAPGMMNWQNFNQYANALGGPAILSHGTNTGSGNASGYSSGTSSAHGKSGGGGVLK